MMLSRAVDILHRLKFIFPHKNITDPIFQSIPLISFIWNKYWASNCKSELKQVQILQNKAIRADLKA